MLLKSILSISLAASAMFSVGCVEDDTVDGTSEHAYFDNTLQCYKTSRRYTVLPARSFGPESAPHKVQVHIPSNYNRLVLSVGTGYNRNYHDFRLGTKAPRRVGNKYVFTASPGYETLQVLNKWRDRNISIVGIAYECESMRDVKISTSGGSARVNARCGYKSEQSCTANGTSACEIKDCIVGSVSGSCSAPSGFVIEAMIAKEANRSNWSSWGTCKDKTSCSFSARNDADIEQVQCRVKRKTVTSNRKITLSRGVVVWGNAAYLGVVDGTGGATGNGPGKDTPVRGSDFVGIIMLSSTEGFAVNEDGWAYGMIRATVASSGQSVQALVTSREGAAEAYSNNPDLHDETAKAVDSAGSRSWAFYAR